MNIPNSPSDLNREEIRQQLWHYMMDNPTSPAILAKELHMGHATLDEFLDPESDQKFTISTLLTIHKFLRDKYKERDAQIKKGA